MLRCAAVAYEGYRMGAGGRTYATGALESVVGSCIFRVGAPRQADVGRRAVPGGAHQTDGVCRAAHFPRRPPAAVVSSLKSLHGIPHPSDPNRSLRAEKLNTARMIHRAEFIGALSVWHTQVGGGLARRFKGGASGKARRGGNEQRQPPARLGALGLCTILGALSPCTNLDALSLCTNLGALSLCTNLGTPSLCTHVGTVNQLHE